MLVSPKFKKFQELLDKVNLVSRESLTGLLVIRAFANKKFEEDKKAEFRKNSEFSRKLKKRRAAVRGCSSRFAK